MTDPDPETELGRFLLEADFREVGAYPVRLKILANAAAGVRPARLPASKLVRTQREKGGLSKTSS